MLDDLNIIVVEDEALLAVDLAMTLEDEGAHVVGPCMSLEQALADDRPVDAAVLDVDLRGRPVFPYADRLAEQGKPFMFHTGRADVAVLRARYGDDVAVVQKPSAPSDVVSCLARAVASKC